jgi:hypothetical protein
MKECDTLQTTKRTGPSHYGAAFRDRHSTIWADARLGQLCQAFRLGVTHRTPPSNSNLKLSRVQPVDVFEIPSPFVDISENAALGVQYPKSLRRARLRFNGNMGTPAKPTQPVARSAAIILSNANPAVLQFARRRSLNRQGSFSPSKSHPAKYSKCHGPTAEPLSVIPINPSPTCRP